jgi:hypothetical protein
VGPVACQRTRPARAAGCRQRYPAARRLALRAGPGRHPPPRRDLPRAQA